MSLCEATPWVLAASMRVGAALKDGACGAKKRNVIGQPPWSSASMFKDGTFERLC